MKTIKELQLDIETMNNAIASFDKSIKNFSKHKRELEMKLVKTLLYKLLLRKDR